MLARLAVLVPGNILQQAHDQAALFTGIDHPGWNFGLTGRAIRFEAALAANQIVVLQALPFVTPGQRDGTLQAEMGDVGDDVAEDPLVPFARIETVIRSMRIMRICWDSFITRPLAVGLARPCRRRSLDH
jgi:hypothetical protein